MFQKVYKSHREPFARSSKTFFYQRCVKLTVGSLVLSSIFAGCESNSTAARQISAAISAELAASSGAVKAPVPLSHGFKAAIAQAVEANSGYRAALAREREAVSRLGVAQSVRQPQLNADLNLGGLQEFGKAGGNMIGLTGGITLSQLIYDGGETTAAINRATAEMLGLKAERVAQENMLALDVARAWIDVWQFDQRVRLLRSRTSGMKTLVDQMERLAISGIIDRAALDNARRQIVDVQLEETRLQADLADAHVRFKRHFRQTPKRLTQPTELVTATTARNLCKAWRYAPSLEALAANVIVARHGVAEAEAAFRPSLRLQTGLRTPMDTTEPASGSLGLGFAFSLLDGRRRTHELEAAIARQIAAEMQLEDDQARLESELASDLERLAGVERLLPLVSEQLRLSSSEAQASLSQITTGQSTLRQLLEGEVEKYRAQDRKISLQAERHILLLKTVAIVGKLGELIGLPTERNAQKNDLTTLVRQEK